MDDLGASADPAETGPTRGTARAPGGGRGTGQLDGTGDEDVRHNGDGRPAEQPPGVQAPLPRQHLSRERIVAAAIEVVDTDGLPALTMRRLGQRLGVEAMALYRYLPSREGLLDAVVEEVVAESYEGDDVDPDHSWQDHLRGLAHEVRRLALAHPALFPLVATRPPATSWIRPPLRSLRGAESLLTTLITRGFTQEQAAVAYRAYTSFLLGHLLLEVAEHSVTAEVLDAREDAPDTSTEARDPHFLGLVDLLHLGETTAEFGESLENLIARLVTMISTCARHL